MAQDSREFQATNIAEKPAGFSFNVAAGRQYRIWAEWGAIESDTRFYFVQNEPIQLEEILFE